MGVIFKNQTVKFKQPDGTYIQANTLAEKDYKKIDQKVDTLKDDLNEQIEDLDNRVETLEDKPEPTPYDDTQIKKNVEDLGKSVTLQSNQIEELDTKKVGYSEVVNGQLLMYSDDTKEHLLATLDLPQTDLSDYVKNTDYATSTVAGVVKSQRGFSADALGRANCSAYNLSEYKTGITGNYFISKGTLENIKEDYVTSVIDFQQGESEQVTFVEGEDLEHYVKDTDIATDNSLGLIKGNTSYRYSVYADGSLRAENQNLDRYSVASVYSFISKGTLENIKESLVKSVVGGDFELIDTYTVEEDGNITIKNEADGTPFNFTNIYVEVAIPPHDTVYSPNFWAYDEERLFARTDYSNLAATTKLLYTSALFERKHGFVFVMLANPSDNYLYGNPTRASSYMAYKIGNIKELRWTNAKAGAVLKLYGIRA